MPGPQAQEIISVADGNLMFDDDPLHVAVKDVGNVGFVEVRFVALDAEGGPAHESTVTPPELQALIPLPQAGESRTLEILATGRTSDGNSYSASRTVRVLAQDRSPIVLSVSPEVAAPGDTTRCAADSSRRSRVATGFASAAP